MARPNVYIIADMTHDLSIKHRVETAIREGLVRAGAAEDITCHISRSGTIYAVNKRALKAPPKELLEKDKGELQNEAMCVHDYVRESLKNLNRSLPDVFLVPAKPASLEGQMRDCIGPVHLTPHLGAPHHYVVPLGVQFFTGAEWLNSYGTVVEVRLDSNLSPIVYNARFPHFAVTAFKETLLQPQDPHHQGKDAIPLDKRYLLPVEGSNLLSPYYLHFDGHHVDASPATTAPTLQLLERWDRGLPQVLAHVDSRRRIQWDYSLEIDSLVEGSPGRRLRKYYLGPGWHTLPGGYSELTVMAYSEETKIRLTCLRQFSSLHGPKTTATSGSEGPSKGPTLLGRPMNTRFR